MDKNTDSSAKVATERGDRLAILRRVLTGPLRPIAAAGVLIVVVAAFTLPFVGRVSDCGGRGADMSNLRQIAQATMIFAAYNGDKLPVATDVWDYARQLALTGGLNDASVWYSSSDPAFALAPIERIGTLLNADRSDVTPGFRELKPSWAVTLGGLAWNMPPSTPVAWTRGLQPDGTWAAHSPYGTAGGHVAFLSGEVKFFKNLTLKNGLARFDGRGPTTDIRKALPPGVRIGEYTPTEAERAAWAEENGRRMQSNAPDFWRWETAVWFVGFLLLILAVITAIALVVVLAMDAARRAWRRRKRGGIS